MPQIFGVHSEHGTFRVGRCEMKITGGNKAIGIAPNGILLGHVSGYRNTPGARVGVSAWEFATRAAGH
ncbi:protein of unknown function [Methylorubrum extorquens DM4]|uniref:Uncharacterized protein n=1 Tax=Methylorubrum extorquens (strain DSM 6343 / CIP 106787 / DM4) TaxID=661410 RepID=C7CBC1_METED|nr:protein of unknown function [Methylorubrum extorquens DM4]